MREMRGCDGDDWEIKLNEERKLETIIIGD